MRKLLFIAATILLVTTASAQQEIVLDHVTGSKGDSLLWAGNTHIISLRLRNIEQRPECEPYTFLTSNIVELSSPDGATWDHSFGRLTESYVNAGARWDFFGVLHTETPDVVDTVTQGDGISPDYIMFYAFSFHPLGGLTTGYDDTAFTIEIATDPADSNLHICLDKPSYGNPELWSWQSFGHFECNTVPDWGGPYCFKIIVADCGDANADNQVNEDDLTYLIDYYFSFGERPMPGHGDVNGDGVIDIRDIVVLAGHLHRDESLYCNGMGPGQFDWKRDPDVRKTGSD